MSKLPVLIATGTIAGGKAREGGKIYAIDEGVVHNLITSGKGRAPTDEEIARLGITEDPATDPGQHIREFGTPDPALAARDAAKRRGSAPPPEPEHHDAE